VKIGFLLKTKLVFKKPKPCKILIYDGTESFFLKKIIQNKLCGILWTRGELINLPCLIKAMKSPFKFFRHPLRTYVDSFIAFCRPKIILTFIDNNKEFYFLKERWEKILIAFIQNGHRELSKSFKIQIGSNAKVDVMFVMGPAIGKAYKKIVFGKAINLGSLKNNFYISQNKAKFPNSVMFISQFREKPKNQNYFIKDSGKHILYEKFYFPEKKLIPFLHDYLRETRQKFLICGCTQEAQNEEEKFFREQLGCQQFEFLPQTSLLSSYKWIERADRIIFIDSTLGYEALARGKRAAAITCRGRNWGNSTRTFGWPNKFPKTGPFWSNQLCLHKVRNIIENLNRYSDREWQKIVSEIIPKIMVWNPNNIFLRKWIRDSLANSQ